MKAAELVEHVKNKPNMEMLIEGDYPVILPLIKGTIVKYHVCRGVIHLEGADICKCNKRTRRVYGCDCTKPVGKVISSKRGRLFSHINSNQ